MIARQMWNRPLIALLLCAATLNAQPTVTMVQPPQHSLTADRNVTIAVTFSEPMDSLSLTNGASIKVFGNQSGYFLMTGSEYETGSNTISFGLDRTIYPGELLTAVVTTAAQAVDGAPLITPFAWTFMAATENASGEFNLVQTLPVGSGVSTPYFITCADLNGDGYLDLATATKSQNSVSILLNDGAGFFSLYETVPSGSSPDAVEAADLDQDGDMDLVVPNSGSASATVLENDGAANFSIKATLTAGTFPHGVALQDIDADGDVDILVNNLGSANLTLYSNDGNGDFTASTISDGNGGPEKVLMTDFDNDGDIDLGITHFSTSTFLVKENDGFAGFPASYTVPLAGSSHIPAAGDLNGDGYVDAVSPHNSNGSVSLILNDGNGELEPAGTFSQSGTPWSVAACDIDADGILELLVCKYNPAGQVAIWENDGNAVFSAGPLLNTGNTPHVVSCGDFNGDGAPDLATANDGSNSVSVFFNTALVGIRTGDQPVLSRKFELLANYPNPFNPATHFTIRLADFGSVRLDIFDAQGRFVKSVLSGELAAGQYEAQWDGSDQYGSEVASGIYLYRLIVNTQGAADTQFAETRKMLLIR